ncbi:MAG: FAD:protein FMN transferase [Roseibacillus sp.]
MAGIWFYLEQKKNYLEEPPVIVLDRYQAQKSLMGTMASVTVYADSAENADDAIAAAFIRGEEINQIASDYLPDSELTRFNAAEAGKWLPASEDLLTMVAYGLELADLTNGSYDPTLGSMTHLWRETKEAKKLPSTETLDLARELSGWELVEVDLKTEKIRKFKDGIRLDLGGLAKGYAADQMLEVLKSKGMPSALILVGGDVRCGQAPPKKAGWSVGLQDFKNELSATMLVSDCAISTSGDLQQFVDIEGRRYSHIIDPSTGLGTTDSLLATVVAQNGLMSDPLATAACVDPTFFSGLSPSTDIHSRILSSSHQQVSSGFPALEPILSGDQ